MVMKEFAARDGKEEGGLELGEVLSSLTLCNVRAMAADDPNPSFAASVDSKGPSKDVNQKEKKHEKMVKDLSDEDLALKQQHELTVKHVQDTDPGVLKLALENVRQGIRTSNSSMISVPKPLKFLCPYYGTLKAYFETMAESD